MSEWDRAQMKAERSVPKVRWRDLRHTVARLDNTEPKRERVLTDEDIRELRKRG